MEGWVRGCVNGSVGWWGMQCLPQCGCVIWMRNRGCLIECGCVGQRNEVVVSYSAIMDIGQGHDHFA